MTGALPPDTQSVKQTFSEIARRAPRLALVRQCRTLTKRAGKSFEGCQMTKTKHSKMGKRLIAANEGSC
jgi:hypothetical protein